MIPPLISRKPADLGLYDSYEFSEAELDPGDLHAPSQEKQADPGQKWSWIALCSLNGVFFLVFCGVLDGCPTPPFDFVSCGTSLGVNLVFLGCSVCHLYLPRSNLLGDHDLNPLK